jgi:hypothetical protein
MSQCTTVAPLLRDRDCMRVLILISFGSFLSRCVMTVYSAPGTRPRTENDLGKEKTAFKGTRDIFFVTHFSQPS